MASTPLIQPAANSPIIISNDSGNIRYLGKRCSVVLSAEHLYIFDFKSKQARKEVHLNNLIGAKSRKDKGVNDHCWLDIFSYDFAKPGCFSCCSKPQKLRVREQISLKFPSSESNCDEWVTNIVTAMNNKPIVKTEEGLILGPQSQFGTSRRFLIFVNPVSGKRTALREYERTVRPMMAEAGAIVTLIVTQYANHAREYVRDFDHTLFDAVITIGGDGMYYEVLNGIFSRPDGMEILRKLPLMPIPG